MPLLKPLTLFTALTLTGCANVAPEKRIEAEEPMDTLKAHMVCCHCGWDTLMPFYSEALNDYRLKRAKNGKR